MTTTIYVLRLEGGRYYVGKTENLMKRYQEHLNGSGSAWTSKYLPTSLIESKEGASPFEEDAYVKKYMAKYGIDNVRGGSYVTDTLTEAQHQYLKAEIWAAEDRCTSCGSSSHWAAACRSQKPKEKKPHSCYRCGRTGHYANTCYARTHVAGHELEDDEDEEEEDDDDEDDDDDY